MQNSIIDVLFSAECGVCDTSAMNEQYKKLRNESYALYEKLCAELSEEQIHILNDYTDKLIEVEGLSCQEYYKGGVKAGIRFATECFY